VSAEAPNILLLMTDQQRYDSLGCYGFEAGHTPNLDRLASEGVLFERCYVNNPVCTPSRASMLTGKHLPGHGVYRLYDNLPDDEVLVTERLQGLGYQTALFGKLHVSSREFEHYRRHPHDGFEIHEQCMEGTLQMEAPLQAYARWLEKEHPGFYARLFEQRRALKNVPRQYHMTRWAVDRTVDFIRNRRDGRPFFAMTSIFDPHSPYEDYPPEMADLVDAARIPGPLRFEDEFAGKPPDLLREGCYSQLGDIEDMSAEEIARMRFGYHASLAFMDQEFGRLLELLEVEGLAEDTLVIFCSDHGDMLGDHGLLAKGAFFYDPCTRVPLILRLPAGRCGGGGLRVPGLVQLHDLAATVLDAAGMSARMVAGLMPEARSLLPLAGGERQTVRDAAICCYRNSGPSLEKNADPYWDPPINCTMLREERYKLNLWHGPEGAIDRRPEGELYDMESDPLEANNLWAGAEHRAVRERMTRRLLDWLAANEGPGRASRGGECRPARKLDDGPK